MGGAGIGHPARQLSQLRFPRHFLDCLLFMGVNSSPAFTWCVLEEQATEPLIGPVCYSANYRLPYIHGLVLLSSIHVVCIGGAGHRATNCPSLFAVRFLDCLIFMGSYSSPAFTWCVFEEQVTEPLTVQVCYCAISRWLSLSDRAVAKMIDGSDCWFQARLFRVDNILESAAVGGPSFELLFLFVVVANGLGGLC